MTGGIDAKRVVDPLPNPGTLNWNNQPAVGTSDDNVSSAGSDGWFDWDVTDLYQHYVDPSNVYNTHYDNNGVALTANNPKTFYAVDAALGRTPTPSSTSPTTTCRHTPRSSPRRTATSPRPSRSR